MVKRCNRGETEDPRPGARVRTTRAFCKSSLTRKCYRITRRPWQIRDRYRTNVTHAMICVPNTMVGWYLTHLGLLCTRPPISTSRSWPEGMIANRNSMQNSSGVAAGDTGQPFQQVCLSFRDPHSHSQISDQAHGSLGGMTTAAPQSWGGRGGVPPPSYHQQILAQAPSSVGGMAAATAQQPGGGRGVVPPPSYHKQISAQQAPGSLGGMAAAAPQSGGWDSPILPPTDFSPSP